MAFQTLPVLSGPQQTLAQIGAFFSSVARAFAHAKNAEARFDEIQMLQALSDEELARRGIERDNIVRHVYADLLGD